MSQRIGYGSAVEAVAKRRIEEARAEIRRAIEQIKNGTPLKAEPVERRAIERVAAVTGVDYSTAREIVNYRPPAELPLSPVQRRKAEALQGQTVDFVGVAWLEAGHLAATSVARIITREGSPVGTGFLVSPSLLLTNHHVIPTRDEAYGLLAEFRYESDSSGRALDPIRFEFSTRGLFASSPVEELDFTLLGLGRALDSFSSTQAFAFNPLSSSAAKHSVGEPVNIVQHPEGNLKQVVVRENRILHRGEEVLHYLADTEPGSSGSPVFNDEWQVVALHHWGEPYREQFGPDGALRTDVNEGIRISAIVRALRERQPELSPEERRQIDEALNAPPPGVEGPRRFTPVEPYEIRDPGRLADSSQRDSPRYPRELEWNRREDDLARIEGVGPERIPIDSHYENRHGYNEKFLRGLPIPLPQLNARQRRIAARVRGIGTAVNPYELKYEHFSVVVNAERRQAFYSIVNIDGAKRIIVERGSGRSRSGPEAAENWAIDPRIPEEAQLSDALYRRMRRALTGGDFLARGHLTRREDPNWGDAAAAERANADTFHHPNGCPQVQNAFNGSQSAWLGIENFILDSADDADQRVTVITGPVFREDDPVFEDEEFGPVGIPRQFWKIVARIEGEKPIVFAVLADQSKALDLLLRPRREAIWEWPRRLSDEFRSSVREIAARTELDFGDLELYDSGAPAENVRLEERRLRSIRELLPIRVSSAGFGRYEAIGDFLEQHERERARSTPNTPAPIAELEVVVKRLLSDDLSGTPYQQFIAEIQRVSKASDSIASELERSRGHWVRVALRYGDPFAILDRVPVRSGNRLRLRGQWISAAAAQRQGGEELPVLRVLSERGALELVSGERIAAE